MSSLIQMMTCMIAVIVDLMKKPIFFPENPMLAQSYVPIQYMDKTFKPSVGLKMGTIFPELVSPYFPGQSMEEINFIEKTNEIERGAINVVR